MAKSPFPRARRSRKVALDRVLHFMNMIQQHGDPEAFIKFCRDNELTITATAKSINAVKQHLNDHNIQNIDPSSEAALLSTIDPVTGVPTCF